jgi:hypothetical protein
MSGLIAGQHMEFGHGQVLHLICKEYLPKIKKITPTGAAT